MKEPRWTAVAPSEFPWEREALDWLRDQLPDAEPWLAWSNLEFIDEDGRVNEVDLLVLAPGAIFLVEIKSRPGVLTGDARTWTWTTDGREYTSDNPLYLANRKCKRLASLLKRQPSFVRSRERLPWIEPAIFLSSTSLTSRLDSIAGAKTYQRGRPGRPGDMGIVSALYSTPLVDQDGQPRLIDVRQARAVARAIAEAGIRPQSNQRRVGDYRLEQLLEEGVNYQDWLATHAAVGARRRVRVYNLSAAANNEARAALARQSRREFQLLEGVENPGIVKVLDYKETELGPALIFEYDADAERLDHWLQRRGATLDLSLRLQLIRELADAIRFAHKRRLCHRALTPASILVHEQEDVRRPLRVQIMNWQTGSREPTGTSTTVHTVGTVHISEYLDDPNRVYLAPESNYVGGSGEALDVFSLGAIAFRVLAGRAPANDAVEQSELLRRIGSLRLSDALDGASQGLQDLVKFATAAQVTMRLQSAEDFLEYLDLAEEELTAPEPESVADPAVAKASDRLANGFTVVKRLARTATADVLLVKRDGSDEEVVLKIASDPRDNDRISGEAEALRGLRHPNIVELKGTIEIAGRSGYLMRRAGEKTLAARLREEGRLSLDLLRRFGEELLDAVRHIEEVGIAHRDIKPDNIGIAPVGERGALHLVLFDFSLTRTPPDNIHAGTRGYLDPFLTLRRPPRWDLYAERYATAVTLYEMATGTLPVWGDGESAPEALEVEATIATETFDPNLRDGLSAFFTKALKRDYRQRFDNAEDMLRTWRRVFDEVRPATTTTTDGLEQVAQTATAQTTLGEVGLSVDAQNVLERLGLHTLRELLAADRVQFRYLSNVGDKIRKEIRRVAKGLAQLRPDLVPGRVAAPDDESGPGSIDELAAHLLPSRQGSEERPDDRAVALYLGLEARDGLSDWPNLGDAARAAGLPRTVVAEALVKVRERWLRSPHLTAVRDELAAHLERHGLVMTLGEAARAVLAERGSAEQDEQLRERLARAVVRAALEAEEARDEPRFQDFAGSAGPVLATSALLADYAKRLGAEADRIALEDPLLSPGNALAALEAVEPPADTNRFAPQRLLRLAVAASSKAALSSRGEVYPKGMPAAQALRQSLGALLGPRRLSVEDIVARVVGRYPECERLPQRPTLDQLLASAGAQLSWHDGATAAESGYYPPAVNDASVGSSTHLYRRPTVAAIASETGPEVDAAREFEDRLKHLLQQGGFLALTLPARLATHAQQEITRRFGIEAVSLDELLIDAMIAVAAELKVDWSVVLKADASQPESTDWRRLLQLAGRAAQRVASQLVGRTSPVLLIEPGLVARYGLMSLVTELQAQSGRAGKTPTTLLLVASSNASNPAIDGVTLPVPTPAHWAQVPEGWVANIHRGASIDAASQAERS